MDKLFVEPLSGQELVELNNGLIKYNEDMDIFGLHGLLCALVSGPRIVPMEEWMPCVLGDADLESVEKAESLFGGVMRMYNCMVYDLSSGEPFQPLLTLDGVLYKPKKLTKEQKSNLPLWCKGYILGMSLDMEAWGEGGDDMAMAAMPILSIATPSEDLPAYFAEIVEMPPTQKAINGMVKESAVILPQVVTGIYNYWREHLVSNTPYRKQQEVGRNESCPCGSGKKYKKCCGCANGTIH